MPSTAIPGEPVGVLRDIRLWMTYLHHRWAIEAGLGYVGGLYQNIGEALPATEPVPAVLQREVLGLRMKAIEPGNLALPETLLARLTPHPGSNPEDLSTDAAFDQLHAARILSALVIEPLKHTWAAPRDREARHASLRRVTQGVALDTMMILGGSGTTTPEARAYILDRLAGLENELASRKDADPVTQAHYRQSARDIARYLENPAAHAPKTATVPWGSQPRSRFPLPPGLPL